MLNTIHSFAKGFGAKVLLALLVLSFAVWGIGDMVRSPNKNRAVATVGTTTIPYEQFQKQLSRESEKVRRGLGENYSPELLKTMQIPQQVLQLMISQALIEEEIKALNLYTSDDYIARLIRNNNMFHDPKGNFHSDIFRRLLARAGITEQDFISQLRRKTSGSLILDTAELFTPMHDAMVRTLHLGREQQRNFTLYIMDLSVTGRIPTATDEQLKAYYQDHPEQFTAPEYRSVSYVRFSEKDAKDTVSISEDEIQKMYQERVDEFRHEESRAVEQLLYSSEEKAKEALAMAREGKSFADIAKQTSPLNKEVISLGSMERKDLMENAAEQVFSLEINGTSDPIKSPFGWHIFHVTGSAPAHTSPLAEVKSALEKDLRHQKLEKAVTSMGNALEDALAGGSTLQEAADELSLKVHTLGPVSEEGLSPEGKPVEVPDLEKFINVAFKTEEKTESSVTFSKGGSYYILYVEKIIPQQVRPFDSIQDTIALMWQQNERQKKLMELAPEISAKLSDASTRNATASRYNLKQVQASSVKRMDKKISDYNLPAQMVADMFVHKPGEGTSHYRLDDSTYIVAVVNSIIPASLPARKDEQEKALKNTREKIAQGMAHEMIDQYMAYLSRKYPVSITPGAVDSATEQ